MQCLITSTLLFARQDVRLDITDLYVFRGEMGTVFVMNVCHSIAGDIPVPGYHPEGMYEFKIDIDADAVEDVTYRVTFGARDAGGRQGYVLRGIYWPRGVRTPRRRRSGGRGATVRRSPRRKGTRVDR